MIESLLSALLLLPMNPHSIVSMYETPLLDSESIIVNHQRSGNSSTLIAQEFTAIQKEGFIFNFIECETTPGSDVPLTCEFLIENTQEERTFGLYTDSSSYPTRIIDASGNEIIATSVKVGSSGPDSSAGTPFPTGVPLKATVTFGQSPEGGIRIFDVGCYIYLYGGFDVEFRPDNM